MGIIGKDKVLREIIEARENLEKKINQYFEILKLLLTKKRKLSSEEQYLLSIPIEHDLWLEAISRFKLKYQIFYLRHLIVILKNVIKRIEIIDKDEAPESYTTALQVYEYNLDSLVEVEGISNELEQDILPRNTNDEPKDMLETEIHEDSKKHPKEPIEDNFKGVLLLKVYDFCIKTNVFGGICFVEFAQYANSAQFEHLFKLKGTVRSKLKYTIFFLSKKTNNNEWYRNAAGSIGLLPKQCSGVQGNLPFEWLEELNKIE